MFIGPAGESREREAKRLAAALLCSGETAPCGVCRDCRKMAAGVHPDFISVLRENNDSGKLKANLLVDQIRAMTADAAVAPNEAGRKVYYIPEADLMNPQAQNALLKSLEEPPGHAAFILCAASAENLLPTIRSRCVRQNVRGETAIPAEMLELADEYLRQVGHREAAGVARFCYNHMQLSAADGLTFLEAVRSRTADALCGGRPVRGLDAGRAFRLQKLCEKAGEYYRRNMNSKDVFGVLAAETLR